jgi:hypothetical protein
MDAVLLVMRLLSGGLEIEAFFSVRLLSSTVYEKSYVNVSTIAATSITEQKIVFLLFFFLYKRKLLAK